MADGVCHVEASTQLVSFVPTWLYATDGEDPNDDQWGRRSRWHRVRSPTCAGVAERASPQQRDSGELSVVPDVLNHCDMTLACSGEKRPGEGSSARSSKRDWEGGHTSDPLLFPPRHPNGSRSSEQKLFACSRLRVQCLAFRVRGPDLQNLFSQSRVHPHS